MENVLLTEGCCIQDADIRHSIIGVRSQIRSGVHVADSIIMGSDYYDSEIAKHIPGGSAVPIGIGVNSHIEGAIVDKNARIGSNVIIRSFPRGTEITTDTWVVRDGIVVIPKNATLPNDTYIGPGVPVD